MAIYRMPVRSNFAIGSRVGMNVWHIRTTSVPVAPAPSISNVIKAFYTQIQSQVPTTMSWTWDGTLQQVGVTDPDVAPAMTPWTVTGTGASSSYAVSGTGVCVIWRSGTASRSGRGRTFIAPVHGAIMDTDGTFTTSSINLFRTAANQLVTSSLADGNGAVSIWSPTQNLGRDVQAATVNDQFAFLSSRRS